jgi:lipoprotein-anchoring transpeptidase ErfK/SrfK
VDLSDQRAVVFDSSGLELFKTAISTGRKGFATPTGTYAITNKYRTWTSTLYDASMPCFQRLSCGDFGFHQGHVPGYPASHGCIRVPAGNAQKFYALTELGDRVEIQP